MGKGPGYDHQDIQDLFRGHELSESIHMKFLQIKSRYEALAHSVLDETPSGPHQTRAINALLVSKDDAVRQLIISWVQEQRAERQA